MNADFDASQTELLGDEPMIGPYKDNLSLYLMSPSSGLKNPSLVKNAVQTLESMYFTVQCDPALTAQDTRFAGTDEERLQAFTRAAQSDAEVVMASRGGYGISRLLHRIDWQALARQPKKYIGYSDFTAFNLALLAQTGMPSFTGPSMTDFDHDGFEPLNAELFVESMRGELEVLNFEAPNSDVVDVRGTLWGGNLAIITSLLGTPYFPDISGGILFLEDVGEHPYRIERMMTSLMHSGVLAKQKAIVLGSFSAYHLQPQDLGYTIAHVWQWVQQATGLPIVRGLPYGHLEVRATLPIGREVGLASDGKMAYLLLDEHDHNHAHGDTDAHHD